MLLTLAAISRVSTLARLSSQVIFNADGATFTLLQLEKSGQRGFFTIPHYECDSLDLVAHVQTYLSITEQHRHSHDSGLFLATVPPHKPVTPSTLSRWLVEVMRAAGIPSEFLGHSTRAARSAERRDHGWSVKAIMSRANWSCKSRTFSVFYDKVVLKD